MFLLTYIDRDTSRTDFYKIYRIMRKVGDRGSIADESYLSDRLELQQTIKKYETADGLCVVKSGRDCDSVEYVHSSIETKPSVMKLYVDRQEEYNWADGPCYVGYCSPKDRPDNHQRDLAMEAYENGHAHFITSATI